METLIPSGTSLVTPASLWLLMVTSDDGRPGNISLHSSNWVLFVRNVYSEPSKADDIQFTLDLIEKVGQEIPAADMDNVNIIGQ